MFPRGLVDGDLDRLLMGISQDERAWSRLADGALIRRARGEDTADEGLEPGRVQPLEENDGWSAGGRGEWELAEQARRGRR